jgi:ribosomal protein L11 methyltransferase
MPFYEIEFPLAGLSADRVEQVLLEAGASSITFLDRGDDPVLEPKPGEFRLWSDTLVRALFDESHDAARNLDLLATGLGSHITASARVRAVEDRVWERVWLEDWKPMRFGGSVQHLPNPRRRRTRSSSGSIPDSRSAPARIPPRRYAWKCLIPCIYPGAQ